LNDFQEEFVFRLSKIRTDDGTNKNLVKKCFSRSSLWRESPQFRRNLIYIKSTLFVFRLWH